MKKRFNIIAILILFTIATSIVSLFTGSNFYEMKNSFSEGFKSGYNKARHPENNKNEETFFLRIEERFDKPKTYQITNTINSKKVSFSPIYIKANVDLENIDNTTSKILQVLPFFALLIIFFALLASFTAYIKFIIATNKNQLFNNKNMRYLNILGWSLIIVFIFTAIHSASYNYTISTMVHFDELKIINMEPINYYLLILGLTSLLIRQFIGIGIKMKEEQELTI